MDQHSHQEFSENRKDLFATTHWSVLCQVGQEDSSLSMKALETLCCQYWYPVYVFVRSRGYGEHDVEDLTQGFFANLLRRDDFAGLSRPNGKFRAFLFASVKNFLSNERDKATGLKRGGGQSVVPLDNEWASRQFNSQQIETLSPDRQFDRSWAMELLRLVLAKLKEDYENRKQGGLFDQLKFSLQGDRSEKTYRVMANDLGLSESGVKVCIHRLREKYRKMLKEAISQTTATVSDTESEIQELMQILR